MVMLECFEGDRYEQTICRQQIQWRHLAVEHVQLGQHDIDVFQQLLHRGYFQMEYVQSRRNESYV